MSIANTTAKTIFEAKIIESNDQTEARVEHLKELESLVGNSYPNKYDRTNITGKEDTISNILAFAPIAELAKQLKDNTPEGEKPDQELKAELNEKLKAFGNVRVSGRLAVPPRVMGKAAFVHLSDGKNRLQIYVRKDDAKAIVNRSEPSAVADGLSAVSENSTDISNDNLQPPATAGGSDLSGWKLFGFLDHGDFIGVEGYLFLTNTGELSVHVETIQFLSKALLPMPDKMHGIADPELQRRYRYADLIASSLQIEHEGLTTREVFERRAKLISGMRRFLDDAGYIEVETPMLTPKATGAAATPFETYHEALGIPLYARIAPELYLKRLTVGGFEKVYELNRNFRNEGLSHKHNPEFTMLEFYCAYMDVNGMMKFAEEMLKESVQNATGGSLVVNYDGREIDFSKFERLSMKEAVTKIEIALPEIDEVKTEFQDSTWVDNKKLVYCLKKQLLDTKGKQKFNQSVTLNKMFVNNDLQSVVLHPIEDKEKIEKLEADGWQIGVTTGYRKSPETIQEDKIKNWQVWEKEFDNLNLSEEDLAKSIVEIFELAVESNLIQPTFITDYPKIISPLSKASPENPQIAERFELFINGMECANGFSELNDPQEQYERFVDQGKERESGDAEAMVLDEDYIRALAYGMPPAAGIGIGIDRLVMLLTNKHSIRDVILFPHMRPASREEETES